MKNQIKFLLWGSILLLLISSCCNQKDRVYWFPDEAVRYYNDHDTVKFYCPESDVFETYVVCVRDSSVSIEQYHANQFCEYAVYRHTLDYRLSLDSCGSSNFIKVAINNLRPGYIHASVYKNGSYNGVFGADFEDCTKISIDVLGYTYHNVIEIPGSEMSHIPSILFSYEYGVIQIQEENQTFSLINNEN